MIDYFPAPDIEDRISLIIELLRFDHIPADSIHCVRSRGSQARRTIARIHGMGRIWQSVGFEPSYVIEVIAERFDGLPESEQDRTLIHELLHIPQGFRGASGTTRTTSPGRPSRPGIGDTGRSGPSGAEPDSCLAPLIAAPAASW